METRYAITVNSDIVIGSTGVLTHEYNGSTQAYVLDLTTANLNIDSGGYISVNARGYTSQYGPGAGADKGGYSYNFV